MGIQEKNVYSDSPFTTTVIVLHDGRTVTVPGVNLRHTTETDDGVDTTTLFIVGFDGPDDQLNPKNWSIGRKWATLGIVGTTGMLVGWASSIDSIVIKQCMEAFRVSEVAGSLATALFLIAFGFGSLVAAPFSETVGRNQVYVVTLSVLMIFTMASGLAPNFGGRLAFRFLAGLFGCTPMTTFGGSMSDIFDPIDRTYAFPVCCKRSFLGPFMAPMIGAFIGQSTHISWRWTEWATLLMAALVTMSIFLFGFLSGYEFIFGKTYGFSQGSVGLTFIGMNVGFLIAFALVPHIYFAYRKRLLNAHENGHDGLPPEERLWFAMYGASWLPISLFWMGWTSYPLISSWSPLVASVAFGFSVQGIFISTYQYLISTYELFAASALVSATFFRYIALVLWSLSRSRCIATRVFNGLLHCWDVFPS